MSLIDIESRDCLKSELDLFETVVTQTSIGDSYYVNYYPVTSISSGGAIEFVVNVSNDVYLDLENTILFTKSKIKKRDGTEITKQENVMENGEITVNLKDPTIVCPINYFHATQFKNIEVYINGRLVSSSDNMSAYRAFIETLLTYSKEAKEGYLQCGMFYIDDGNDLDLIDDAIDTEDINQTNIGLWNRFQNSKYSRYFETCGKIHTDIFTQNKMLPGGNELRIKFHRNDPSFCLMSKLGTENYQIVTDEMVLKIKHCEIAPHIRESHAKALLSRRMKYPMTKVEMKFFTRGSGRNDLSEPNLVNGTLPSRVIVGLVRSDAFNGNLTKNPFNFQHFNVQNIILRKNGTPMPFEEISLDYQNNCFYEGYMSLIVGTGKLYDDQGFAISPGQYPFGYALYAFDLSDSTRCDTIDLIQEGKLSLELKLSEPIEESVTTVVYLEYNTILELDNDGNCHISQ